MASLTSRGPGLPRWAEGAACMIVAATGFALMNACAKEATRRLPFLEVAAARSLVGLPLVFAYARARGVSLRVHNRPVAFLRVLFGTAAMAQTFYALSAIPLAEASALLNLTPLFVALVGALWLGERVGKLVAFCLGVGLLGVMLIFRPQSAHLGLGGLSALGASLTSALAMASLRRLGATESPEAVVLAFLSGSSAALGLLALPHALRPTAREGWLLLVAGVSATVAQLAMTRAYALDVAARVGGMNYLNIVAGLALAAFAFGERPDSLALAGIAAIVAAGALLVWSSRKELGWPNFFTSSPSL